MFWLKIPKKGIFGPKFSAFLYLIFFAKFFQLDNFQGADFKSDNSVFKILTQKCLCKSCWVKYTQK